MTSAFIIEVNSQLQPDPGDETAALLRVLIYEINNSAFGGNIPTLPQWTGPPPTMVHVQAILFSSLAISLFSAFLAMLGKQWLNRYASTDMRGSAVERSQHRQRKLDGIVAWYFSHVMELLPLMLQAALLLLGCALSRYLWDISITVASVVIGVASFGVTFYLFITLAGAVSESCPYQTPGSHILRYLGPKVWRTIHSARYFIGPASRNASERSDAGGLDSIPSFSLRLQRARTVTGPSLKILFLKAPLELPTIVYRRLRASVQALSGLPTRAYHLFRSINNKHHDAYSALKQRLAQRRAQSDFRCISWTLQTSLDKPIHQTALKHLSTMTEFTGLDPTLVADCFNVFVGCISFSDHKLVVMQGLEQLAMVSTTCFFRTFHHLSVTDPTSSVLADLRRRYHVVFPPETDFRGLPFYHTMMKTHNLANKPWNRRNLRWDHYRPSVEEHIQFARHLVEAAQLEYQQMVNKKVPRWILHFALHSLSLDPPPSASAVADCLAIVAIDLDCDVSNVVTLDERCVTVRGPMHTSD